jgi:hypothetical protein
MGQASDRAKYQQWSMKQPRSGVNGDEREKAIRKGEGQRYGGLQEIPEHP